MMNVKAAREAAPNTAQAHAFTNLDFTQAARTYGRVGGFAHLATLIKQLRASRPNSKTNGPR